MYNTINDTDRIFATVTNMHTTVCNLAISGVTSMSEIVRRVRHAIGDEAMHTATLTVRNSTQGWMMRHRIHNHISREPQQLTLTF